MPVPRYRLLLLAMALLALAFFVPITVATNTDFIERSMDAVHLPVFAFVTWLLFYTNPIGFVARAPAIAFATVTGLLLAGAVELIQMRVGRDATWIDFLNGAAGALLTLGFLLVRLSPGALGMAGLTAALVITVSAPAANQARAIAWRATHFPLLGDFESDAEMPLWTARAHDHMVNMPKPRRASIHATHGFSSLYLQVVPGTWPGVRLLCADQNWIGYQTLAFDLYNEGPPFELSLRVDDADSKNHSNRFNRAIAIAPGLNRVQLSLAEVEREMKPREDGSPYLSAIRRVIFFVEKPTQQFDIYLDHVRLE